MRSTICISIPRNTCTKSVILIPVFSFPSLYTFLQGYPIVYILYILHYGPFYFGRFLNNFLTFRGKNCYA